VTIPIREMNIKILPSLLAADFSKLGAEVGAVDSCGADGIHCDIMDGRFVPNITFGPMVVRAIRPYTRLPLYVHLMIEQPERYVEDFVAAGAAEITVHAEACVHLHRVLQQIKSHGVRAGIALNPSTPLCVVENVLNDIDLVLIMTVNPGFGGQSFIETILPKIARARAMLQAAQANVDIAVDGGIDEVTASRVVRAGANVLIAGTSIFGNDGPIAEACAALRLSAQVASCGEEA
jgi:ribulose-phosphate 3-epimerase